MRWPPLVLKWLSLVLLTLALALGRGPWVQVVSSETLPQPVLRCPTAPDCLQLGQQQYQQGEFDAVQASWQRALELAQAAGDTASELLARDKLGLLWQTLGELAAAQAQYEALAALAVQVGDRPAQANALGNLGNLAQTLGHYLPAIDFYQQAIAQSQALGDSRRVGRLQGNLGNVYEALGQYDQAETLLQSSLSTARQQEDIPGALVALNSLGILAGNRADYAQAAQFYQQALRVAVAVGQVAAQANLLNNLGATYHLQQDFPRAQENYERSLAIAQQTQDLRLEAAALGGLGLVRANLGQLDAAARDQAQAVALARELGDRRLEALALNNLGDTYRQQGQLTAAAQALATALRLLDSLRDNLSDRDRIAIFDTQVLTYTRLQQVLVAQGKIEAALEAAERGRSRALAALLHGQGEEPDVTLAALRQLARQQQATLVEFATIPDSNFIAQGKLKGKTVELYTWVVSPDGAITFQATDLRPLLGDRDLPELITDLRRALNSRLQQRSDALLEQLYDLLVAPIADQLPRTPEAPVVIVPHDVLFLVPFAALRDPQGHYLVDTHTLIAAPSLQVLDLTLRRPATGSWRSPPALVVGNPTMPTLPGASQPLSPLPGTEVEAQAIAAALGAAPLLGDRATEVAVSQQLERAHLIHLATHGLLNEVAALSDTPGAIALAATGPAPAEDGFLTANEVSQHRLQADLAVLSACDTGRGRITGDGAVGLARSFLAAGARSVVVSLWKVPDQPTALLMQAFYEELARSRSVPEGLSPSVSAGESRPVPAGIPPTKAQALRQALRRTQAQYPNPRDWAAFLLVGDGLSP